MVGTSVATQKIRNGNRTRINGTFGLVEILEAAVQPAKNEFGF